MFCPIPYERCLQKYWAFSTWNNSNKMLLMWKNSCGKPCFSSLSDVVSTGENSRWYLKLLCYSEAFSLKVCCDTTVLLWLQETLFFVLKIGEISSRSQEAFCVHFEVSTWRNKLFWYWLSKCSAWKMYRRWSCCIEILYVSWGRDVLNLLQITWRQFVCWRGRPWQQDQVAKKSSITFEEGGSGSFSSTEELGKDISCLLAKRSDFRIFRHVTQHHWKAGSVNARFILMEDCCSVGKPCTLNKTEHFLQ